MSAVANFVVHSGTLRHIGSSAFCAEANSSDINGVDGGCVSFADFGGTAVSNIVAKLLVTEVDSKESTARMGPAT
jgi:hypothetical protein